MPRIPFLVPTTTCRDVEAMPNAERLVCLSKAEPDLVRQGSAVKWIASRFRSLSPEGLAALSSFVPPKTLVDYLDTIPDFYLNTVVDAVENARAKQFKLLLSLGAKIEASVMLNAFRSLKHSSRLKSFGTAVLNTWVQAGNKRRSDLVNALVSLA